MVVVDEGKHESQSDMAELLHPHHTTATQHAVGDYL